MLQKCFGYRVDQQQYSSPLCRVLQHDYHKKELVDIPNCPTCGRKTQVIQKMKPPKSGKNQNWSKFKHRCEMHGVFNGMVHKERKGES